MKTLLAKVGLWLLVREILAEADAELTEANAELVRTRILDAIQKRFTTAQAKGKLSKRAHLLSEVYWFAGMVLHSNRLLMQADPINPTQFVRKMG